MTRHQKWLMKKCLSLFTDIRSLAQADELAILKEEEWDIDLKSVGNQLRREILEDDLKRQQKGLKP